MNEKLLPLLGIARRAGRLSLGFDAATESMQKGKSQLLLLANDLSERTVRNISMTARHTETCMIATDFSMQQFGAAVGKDAGIISVNDKGFAKKMKTLCADKEHP